MSRGYGPSRIDSTRHAKTLSWGGRPGAPEPMSAADAAFEEHGEKGPDAYSGKCGGCGGRVGSSSESEMKALLDGEAVPGAGSCLHRWVPKHHGTAKPGQSVGPWHPSCREQDRRGEEPTGTLFA